MPHPKKLDITKIDRFKQAIKVLGHLSVLFLVIIFACGTPAFAQDAMQKACSDTKISLPIFIPLKILRDEIERVVPKQIKTDSNPKYTLKRSHIRLAKTGEKFQVQFGLDGTTENKFHPNNWLFGMKGKVTLWMNPKFKEDWGIEPHFERDVSVPKAGALGGMFGAMKHKKARTRVKAAIRVHVDDRASALSNYLQGEAGLKKSLQKFWFALNTMHKLQQTPTVSLAVAPTALAITQLAIDSTGVRINLVVNAKTNLKFGMPARNTTSVQNAQLPTKLAIIETPPDGHINLTVPKNIKFKEINSLIQNHLPAEKTGDYGALKLEEIEIVLIENNMLLIASMSLKALGWLPRSFKIDAFVKPTVVSTGRQVSFKDITLSENSDEKIRTLAIFNKGLTGEVVKNLIKENIYVNLDDHFKDIEVILQTKLDHYAKKLKAEKNIEITAKILSKTPLTPVATNKHGLLVKICVATTLKIETITLKKNVFNAFTL